MSKMVIGVLGLAVNKKGEFLVTLRKDEEPHFDKKWQIPGGGMEFGETAEETCLREMREELGVEAKIHAPYSINYTQVWNFDDKNAHVYLCTYLLDIGEQEIYLNEEAYEYRWVTSKTIDRSESLPATPIILERAEAFLKLVR